MESFLDKQERGALAAGILVITLSGTALISVGEDSTRDPRAARYFGEEFAEAQRALQSQPRAEMPQAF